MGGSHVTHSVPSPAFVGRDVEQQWLRETLARPSTRLVVIEGEAGIGKSRFVHETLPDAVGTGGGVLLLRCPPVTTPFPMGTLVEALAPTPPDPRRLGRLAGALRPLFPEWWDILPEPLPPAESSALERHRLFRALAELVRTLGFHTVVLDDAHWADHATHEFLLHLATVDGDAPVRVVETWRTEERPDPHLVARILRIAAGGTGRVIPLGPLDPAGTEKFVASMLRGPLVSPRVADLLHQRTQGIPLLLEDLVRTLNDQMRSNPGGVQRSTASIGALAPPASLRESVAARTERLTEAARLAGWALAVLAEPATVPLLATVTGLDHQEASTAVDDLLAAHLLSPADGGEISFRHALVLDAVADQVPLGERSRLHARAAAALGALPAPPVVRLARHLKLSGDTAGWARYAEQVADLALARADDLTAANILLELATVTVQEPADLTRIVAKIPFAVFRGVEPYRAVEEVLRRAAEVPGLSRLDQGRVRWLLARVLILEDRMSEAAEETRRAVPLLADEPLLAGQAMINSVHLSWPTWSFATRQAWLQQAARLLQDRDAASELRLTSDLATVLLRFGSVDGWREAARIPTRDIKVGDRLNAARGLGNIGHCALIWGRYATARTALSAAFELAHTYDYPVVSAELEDISLHLDYVEGSWEGLRERAAALVAAARSVGGDRLDAEVVEARLLVAEGRSDDARRRLREVLDHPASRLGPELVMEACAVLAEVALGDGDPEEALALTLEPFSLIERTGVWLWGTDLVPARVRALLLTGSREEALAVVDAMASGVGGGSAPAADAALLSCRALLAHAAGDLPRARALHRQAAGAWRALPRPHEEARELEAAARCLPESARQETVAELRDVLRRYTRLGATVHAERVAAALRTAGVETRGPGRRGRKGYGARLSPREREVVRLVAAGETDSAIALKLFKSPHTVQSQVKSAKQKLGVSTRAELARAAAELVPDDHDR
ncbi:AAA family ATPase [Streptomyces sp. NPDC048277]|uniref:helix-turn-helix transcriptional regulator n=1 Tax=Streptomyces sp. NPDC048277 TaxID=3155027 RepID=UPI0033CB5BA9